MATFDPTKYGAILKPKANAASKSFNPLEYGAKLKNQPQAANISSDNKSADESIYKSIGYAIPRVLLDTANIVSEQVPKIPHYLSKGWEETTGLPQTLMEHPGHVAKQAIAASQELTNLLAQIPLNIANYGEQRLHLVPHAVTKGVEALTPENTQGAINQLFDQPKYPGEEMVRGVIGNLPLALGAGKIGGTLAATKSSIKKSLLKPHDALESAAEKGFNTVSKEVNNRGISVIPVNPQDILNLGEYFPKTKAAQKLLTDASQGDYNALRKVQSDLYKSGKKNVSSDMEVDRLRGAEMMEKRGDINDAIADHLRNTGNLDLFDMLTDANVNYRTLKNQYYNPRLPSALTKMFDKDMRKVPDNLPTLLSEDSRPMQQFRESHPGLGKQLTGYGFKHAIINALGKYGVPTSVAAGIGYLSTKNQPK